MGATRTDTANSGDLTHWLARPVPAGWLVAALLLWLAGGQMLLWRFLDVAPWWAYALGAGATLSIIGGVLRAMRAFPGGPSRGTLLACVLTALILLILGGEGRFFYANVDWQVRFAVLHDMGVNPWPFVYTHRPVPDVLRAPIGMFLAPALVFKAFGPRAADIALLVQNGLMIGIVLALSSMLFASRRSRIVALGVFLAFSGMDAIGELLINGAMSSHMEDWANIQYSSTVTLAFWVPQHALAGWIGAVGYMLWRREQLPLVAFLALLPMTALWSPLGLMGAMPFAVLAGVRTLLARRLTVGDIAVPAMASLMAIPGLLYMGAAGDDVGLRFIALPFTQWATFQALETWPFLVPLLLARSSARFGRDTLWLALVWLMLIPFVQIGWSIDFMMRGSITALAIVTAMMADRIGEGGAVRTWLLAVLAIGSLTGLSEIRRAFQFPAAPQVRCTFFKAWDQNFAVFPKGSYLAPLPQMPALIRPAHPALASAQEPARCWDGQWPSPLNLDNDPSGGKNGVE